MKSNINVFMLSVIIAGAGGMSSVAAYDMKVQSKAQIQNFKQAKAYHDLAGLFSEKYQQLVIFKKKYDLLLEKSNRIIEEYNSIKEHAEILCGVSAKSAAEEWYYDEVLHLFSKLKDCLAPLKTLAGEAFNIFGKEYEQARIVYEFGSVESELVVGHANSKNVFDDFKLFADKSYAILQETRFDNHESGIRQVAEALDQIESWRISVCQRIETILNEDVKCKSALKDEVRVAIQKMIIEATSNRVLFEHALKLKMIKLASPCSITVSCKEIDKKMCFKWWYTRWA